MSELRKMGAEVRWTQERRHLRRSEAHRRHRRAATCAPARPWSSRALREGVTTIEDVAYIERLPNIVGKLRRLGADLVSVSETAPEDAAAPAHVG
jgi:UDP-N-acetylglucosamine enolpyruvyl transferase